MKCITEILPQCPSCESWDVYVRGGRHGRYRYRACRTCGVWFKGRILNPPSNSSAPRKPAAPIDDPGRKVSQ